MGKEKGDAYFIRHGASSYKTYNEIRASDNPQCAFNPDNQHYPDLTEQGVKDLESKAEIFFSNFDPVVDRILFVSSEEARALQTAAIYLAEAKKRGFKVVRQADPGSDLSAEVGGGEIRAMKELSLQIDNIALHGVYNPIGGESKVNWDAVDNETKARWQQAREIIAADDRGSWGKNFLVHSEAVKKVFPELSSARDLFDTQFQTLLKLVKKCISGLKGKNIKIIAFGHENYLAQALEEYFAQDGIGNGEAIGIILQSDGSVEAEFRAKSAVIGKKKD